MGLDGLLSPGHFDGSACHHDLERPGRCPSVGRARVRCRRGSRPVRTSHGPDQVSITKLRGAASQQRHHVAMSFNCAVASCSVFPAHVWVGALYIELAPGFPGSSSGKARPHEAGKD